MTPIHGEQLSAKGVGLGPTRPEPTPSPVGRRSIPGGDEIPFREEAAIDAARIEEVVRVPPEDKEGKIC